MRFNTAVAALVFAVPTIGQVPSADAQMPMPSLGYYAPVVAAADFSPPADVGSESSRRTADKAGASAAAEVAQPEGFQAASPLPPEAIVPQSSEPISAAPAPNGSAPNVSAPGMPAKVGAAHMPNCRCAACSRTHPKGLAVWTKYKRHMQASHWGYPEYFCEPPFGASVVSAMQAQRTYGLAERSTLYLADFYPESSQFESDLTPYGKRRLEKLVQRGMCAGVPLWIEQTPNNLRLDEARRLAVLEYAGAVQLALPPEMVLLTHDVRSLSGVEAILQYRNQLNHTLAGPASGEPRGGPVGSGAPLPTTGLPIAPVSP